MDSLSTGVMYFSMTKRKRFTSKCSLLFVHLLYNFIVKLVHGTSSKVWFTYKYYKKEKQFALGSCCFGDIDE